MRVKLLLLFLFLFDSFFFHVNAQQVKQKEFYNFFDENIGIENTSLYQGILYRVSYRTGSDETEFFENNDFVKGSVIYDGQYFGDLDLKYNVYNDQVLLKLISKVGGGTIILFNEILERFDIGNHSFIKIERTEAPEIDVHGFYEVSLESPFFTFYTKHRKKSIEKKDKRSLYYEFVDTNGLYVLHYENKYHTLKSKKDVNNLFPELKPEIDKFYRLASRLRKSNPNGFQVALFKRIDILLSQITDPS